MGNAPDQPTSVILQRFPLGFQWPTVDPFLFCVHHLDHYPAGNGAYGPVTGVEGRNIGSDFEGIDGWRMYHGQTVPGFPQHPHRGFETVTFVRQGLIDHSDSLGAAARYGEGDVQWLTAGSGIVHAEMFPLLNNDAPNTAELFQIWLNLPKVNKMAPPHFTMLWNEDIPQTELGGGTPDAPKVQVTVVAGELAGHTPPAPPPHSWASQPDSDVAIWHIRMQPGSSCVLPAAKHADTLRVAYAFDGADCAFAGESLEISNGGLIECNREVVVSSTAGAEILILQGRPIGEPVAQYGPFVMNDKAGIEQAFRDYQTTQFGGWPWPTDDPVHGPDARRFAQQPERATS
jgi:quercetin 2,3-dioxygenase